MTRPAVVAGVLPLPWAEELVRVGRLARHPHGCDREAWAWTVSQAGPCSTGADVDDPDAWCSSCRHAAGAEPSTA